MRKFFAATMAAAMVMSMGATSFAATNIIADGAFDFPLDYSSDNDSIKVEKKYDVNLGQGTATNIELNNMIEYGDTAYYPLVDEAGAITDYDRVEKLKVKVEYEMGEEYVDSISVVKKPVKTVVDNAGAVTHENIVELFDFDGFLKNGVTITPTYNTSLAFNTAATAVGNVNFKNTFGLKAADVTAAETAAENAAVTAINALSIGDAAGDINLYKNGAKIDVSTITSSTALDGVTAKLGDDARTTVEAAMASEVDSATIRNEDNTTATIDVVNNTSVKITKSFATKTDYYYFLAVKTKKVDTTSDADIIGTFEFDRKANTKVTPAIAQIKDEKHDFAINLWYDGNYAAADATGTTYYEVGDEASLKWDDMYVLKFNSDEEVTLNFGYENEGEFTVDVSGQGKLLINFSTKANEAIADANPGVKMMFVNFNGAKFNRVGEFEYEMEDLAAAYQIVDDKLVALNSLEISSDTATFYTRTLGNYVFADAELVNPVVEAPVVEAPAEVVTNPTTGVNA